MAQPLDILYRSEQKSQDYTELCLLLNNLDNEAEHLERKVRNSESFEIQEEYEYAQAQLRKKRAALIAQYVERYSPYQLKEKIQLIQNNRQLGIGVIEDVSIIYFDETRIKHPAGFFLDTMSAASNYNEHHHFQENEFRYRVSQSENQSIMKHLGVVPYRVESALRMIKMPSKLIHQCPVCEVVDKPMVDMTMGGENVVICEDCRHIINDLFGEEYARTKLTLKEVKKHSYLHVIQKYSENR